MDNGLIYKALSGFYYVKTDGGLSVRCRARGRFRIQKVDPLVGDRVTITIEPDGFGVLESILPRKNSFVRPPLANLDMMVIVVSAVIPVTDPFLIDRMIVISERSSCEPVICINKADIDHGDKLFNIYSGAGFKTLRVSAATGEGIDDMRAVLLGRISALTGNSGVGKSSILNLLDSGLNIPVGSVSEKLGRGKHTTRHVELLKLDSGALVADTPGFSSFETEMMDRAAAGELQYAFREFRPYIGNCRFDDCAHIKEIGCAVLKALEIGNISTTRHSSYVRLYEAARARREWE